MVQNSFLHYVYNVYICHAIRQAQGDMQHQSNEESATGLARYCSINTITMIFRTLFRKINAASGHILVILLILLITFPELTPSVATGLDNSYIWAFNYLFNHNFEVLRNLIYPLGPLGFLKFPLAEGSNPGIALAFYTVLKVWFIAAFLHYPAKSARLRIQEALLVVLVSYFLPLELLITGIAVIHAAVMIEKQIWLHMGPVSLMVVVGLFIKASMGVLAFSVLGMAILVYHLRYNYWQRSLWLVTIAIFIVFLCGSIIMGGFLPCLRFCWQSVRLTMGYSGALALFPDNNWWLISGFILTIISIPFINRSRRLRNVFILMILPAFAIWKYGITRQDIYHYTMMVYFFIVFWAFIITYSKEKKLWNLVIACISITLIYSNMKNVNQPAYQPIRIEINGINHFADAVLDHTQYKSKHAGITSASLERNRLSDESLAVIGNSTVDVYPWELTYIPANNLNWKPRRTLQGGSYARWLDDLGAADFSRSDAPDVVLLHFVKDLYNGDFGSIDGRYLLNDNPKTILAILNHFSPDLKTNTFMIYRKNSADNLKKFLSGEMLEAEWGEWLTVPENDMDVIRVKVWIKNTVWGNVISFLYKPVPYHIDYMLEDDRVLTYRFIPDNAEDGLWVHPLVQDAADNNIEAVVTAIRLRNEDQRYCTQTFDYQFERIVLSPDGYGNSRQAGQLFGKIFPDKDSTLVSLNYLFSDSLTASLTFSCPDYVSFSKTGTGLIESKGYSFTWMCRLDSLWNDLDVRFTGIMVQSVVHYLNHHTGASLVISLEDSSNDFWLPQALTQNRNGTELLYAHNRMQLSREQHPAGLLKVYVWNHGNSPLTLKELHFKIKASVD